MRSALRTTWIRPRRSFSSTTSLHNNSPTKNSCLTVGTLKLASNIVLAPLERVSDVGFRRLCFQNGAALTWTEMVYCSDLVRGRTLDMIDTFDNETLTGIQLLVDKTTRKDGWGTDLLLRSLEYLERHCETDRPEWKNIVAVDLNFGCPSPAINKRGAGPSQLRRCSKIHDLFRVLQNWKNNYNSSLNIQAVGAKIRLGSNLREQQYKVYLPVAQAAAETLDYLTVHARHGQERSSDAPTWQAIAEVVAATQQQSSIKIFGNGDVRTRHDMETIMNLTGCHGVMIGRAAMRNPWCFTSLASHAPEQWPTLEQVEWAAKENEAWSAHRPGDVRYRRFRNENFERLRAIAFGQQAGSDWYEEWSQAATRRRHLNKMDDEEQRLQQSQQEVAFNHQSPA